MSETGEITLLTGPMFSGKSKEMMRRVKRYRYANKKILVIKQADDLRHSPDISVLSTFDKETIAAVAVRSLREVSKKMIKEAEVIGVDEGHFYPDLVEKCEEWASAGKVVIVAALNSDFRRMPFPVISELIPKAEKIKSLSAICECGETAHFSMRLVHMQGITNVGGAESYAPACRACHRIVCSEHTTKQ